MGMAGEVERLEWVEIRGRGCGGGGARDGGRWLGGAAAGVLAETEKRPDVGGMGTTAGRMVAATGTNQ